MDLSILLHKIISEAQEEAKLIQQKSKAAILEIYSDFEKKEQEEIFNIEKKTQDTLNAIDMKAKAHAHNELSEKISKIKEKTVQEMLERFLFLLENSDSRIYEEILKKLFSRIPSGSGNGKILCPPKRMEVTSRLAPKRFPVIAEKNITAGFIFQNGEKTLDCTFRHLVFAQHREKLVSFFAKQLGFPKEATPERVLRVSLTEHSLR